MAAGHSIAQHKAEENDARRTNLPISMDCSTAGEELGERIVNAIAPAASSGVRVVYVRVRGASSS
jgi:hypothetical protein